MNAMIYFKADFCRYFFVVLFYALYKLMQHIIIFDYLISKFLYNNNHDAFKFFPIFADIAHFFCLATTYSYF